MAAHGEVLTPTLASFVLDEALLIIEPTELARGANGAVYRGSYNGQPVCVKVCFEKYDCGLRPVSNATNPGAAAACNQTLLTLLDFDLYGIEPGSAEHLGQSAELRSEALALLAPGARHDNIVRLLGVVPDDDHHVKQLVFELAEEGSLDKHIQRLLRAPDGRCVGCRDCRFMCSIACVRCDRVAWAHLDAVVVWKPPG